MKDNRAMDIGAMALRSEFNLDEKIIYLNSGTHSIVPRSVLDAIERELRAYELNPTELLENMGPRLWAAQTRVAKFLGSRPQDLFLRSNVTEAMNAFLLGMPLPAGEILATDLEYGAVLNLCRFLSERDGRPLRRVALAAEAREMRERSAGEWVERIVREIRPETRLLVVSHVFTGTGLVLPIAEVARETRRRGILLVVDGAHGPGAVELDFAWLEDVDFYGGNIHKWMMGPKGTAFGWMPERHHAAIQPLMAGWQTFDTSVGLDFGEGDRFAARMLMPGCQDFSRFLALDEMIGFWERHGGFAAVNVRRAELTARAAEAVGRATGWERITPDARELQGPLVAFDLPRALEQEGPMLMKRIMCEAGLQISTPVIAGRTVARISPHIYNMPAEIERAAGMLAKL